jgi:hypothetical protein
VKADKQPPLIGGIVDPLGVHGGKGGDCSADLSKCKQWGGMKKQYKYTENTVSVVLKEV